MIKLSLIIPIKVTFQNRFLMQRLIALVEFFSIYEEIELLVVDSSPHHRYSTRIAKIPHINYHYIAMEGIYSAAKARNHGTRQAKGEYILFFDVDLRVSELFIPSLFEEIEALKSKAKEAFTLYPCLYLSESKTKKIALKRLDHQAFEEIKIRYLEGFNDEVLYLAVNTSTILVSKAHFFDIGGYNEVFKGHGYEDFELIHRLYLAYPLVQRDKNYAMDFKTPFPYGYQGFRQYFAYYALPNFFKGNYTLHLWHPRPLTKKYYRHREVNLHYFLAYLQDSLCETIEGESVDYHRFIDDLCMEYGFGDQRYCGLRALNSIAKNQKPKFNLKRKLRRRFLNLWDKIR